MARWAFKIYHDERGQDLIEYAMLAGLVCIIAVVIPTGTLDLFTRIYERVHEQFDRLTN